MHMAIIGTLTQYMHPTGRLGSYRPNAALSVRQQSARSGHPAPHFSGRSCRQKGNLKKDLHWPGGVPNGTYGNRLVHIYIIYTRTVMLVSKHPFQSWKEIQSQYPDYITSLGPWEESTVIEYLADEYPELSPHPQEQIDALIADAQIARVLTFAA